MTSGLDERLVDLWLAAQAAWPGVQVPVEVFVGYLQERAPNVDAIASLNTGDLYLACACTLRVPGALESLERALLVHVPRMVVQMDPSGQLGEEVRQTMRERLLMGRNDGRPRIAAYGGRGSLLAWLRVTASRIAIDLLNQRNQLAETPLDDAAEIVGQADGDLELIKQSYRQEFEEAVSEALRDLPRRERTLLRLHLVNGVSTHKLGAMFHVDQSTIARTLAAARSTVREATRARLVERLRLGKDELESLAALMLSRIDLSLGGCLRSREE
jgi:RNA polymerase sigma-70 factor (ECF subfamily)